MNRSLALPLSVAALALAAAGCGGSDDDGSSGGGDSGGASSGGAKSGGSASKGGAKVSMKDIAFKPGSITIKKGQAVTWTNDDGVGHDVTGQGGPGGNFKSGSPGGLMQGDTFSHKFTKPGTVQYVCTVHGNMKGSIKVE
jgi:plastocyanin